MAFSTKEIFDKLNLKIARLKTSKNNSSNVYEQREINRAIKELDNLRKELREKP